MDYTLDRLFGLVEGVSDDLKQQQSHFDDDDDDNTEKEDPDVAESDFKDASRELAKECGSLEVNAESASVAIDMAALACCEAYIRNPSRYSKQEMNSVMEGVIGDVWNKIKEWFKKLWAKIKEWWNKLKMYIQSFFMDGHKFLKLHQSELDEKYDMLAERKIRMDLYDIDAIRKDIEKDNDFIDDVGKNAKEIIDFYTGLVKEIDRVGIKSGAELKKAADDDKKAGRTISVSNVQYINRKREFEKKINDINDRENALFKNKDTTYKKYSTLLTKEIAKKNVIMGAKSALEIQNTSNTKKALLETIVGEAEKAANKAADLSTNYIADTTSVSSINLFTSNISKRLSNANTVINRMVKNTKLLTSQAVAIARAVLGGSAAKKESYYGEFDEYESSTNEYSILSSVMKFI